MASKWETGVPTQPFWFHNPLSWPKCSLAWPWSAGQGDIISTEFFTDNKLQAHRREKGHPKPLCKNQPSLVSRTYFKNLFIIKGNQQWASIHGMRAACHEEDIWTHMAQGLYAHQSPGSEKGIDLPEVTQSQLLNSLPWTNIAFPYIIFMPSIYNVRSHAHA